MGLNAQFNTSLGKTVTKGNYNAGTIGYNLNYKRGKGIYGVTTVQPVGAVSMGVKKEVLKKKGSILLNINDLFWSEKYREHASFLTTNVFLKSYSPSRKINLSFSYRFGRNFDHSGEVPDEMKRVQK
jgi:hypothetical protein